MIEPKSKAVLESDLGTEPELLAEGEEMRVTEDVIRHDVIHDSVAKYSLAGLADEFYMFCLGPFVVGARLDFDPVSQFGIDYGEHRIEHLITLQLEKDVLRYLHGWGNIVQALPKAQGKLFAKYLRNQVTITQTTSKPYEYWQARVVDVNMIEPGTFGPKVCVHVFYPTGIKCDYVIQEEPDNTFWFKAESPEPEIVLAATAHFKGINLIK